MRRAQGDRTEVWAVPHGYHTLLLTRLHRIPFTLLLPLMHLAFVIYFRGLVGIKGKFSSRKLFSGYDHDELNLRFSISNETIFHSYMSSSITYQLGQKIKLEAHSSATLVCDQPPTFAVFTINGSWAQYGFLSDCNYIVI